MKMPINAAANPARRAAAASMAPRGPSRCVVRPLRTTRTMKTKLMVLTLIALAILWATSVTFAYHRGYRHGGDAERACWTLEPATTEALIRGEIMARRDTKKHPFLEGRIDQRSDRTVNSFPVPYSPR